MQQRLDGILSIYNDLPQAERKPLPITDMTFGESRP
jgi:hypothetical protein